MTPVLTAHSLEHGPAGGDGIQLRVERRLETVESGGEQVQPALGYGATAQGVDDGTATSGADLDGAL